MPYSAFPALKLPYDVDGTLMFHGIVATSIDSTLTPTEVAELNDPAQGTPWTTSSAAQAMRLWWFFPVPWQITHWYGHAYPGGLGTLTITLNSVQGSNDTTDGSDGTWETATLTGGTPSGISTGATEVFDLWRTGIRAITFTQPYRVIRVQISNTATSAGAVQNYVSFHWYGTKPVETHDLVFIDGGSPVTIVHDFGDIQREEEEEVKAFALRNLSATRTAEDVVVSLPTQSPATQGVSVGPTGSGPWTSSIDIGDIAPSTDSADFYVRSAPPLSEPLAPRVYPMVATVNGVFFD